MRIWHSWRSDDHGGRTGVSAPLWWWLIIAIAVVIWAMAALVVYAVIQLCRGAWWLVTLPWYRRAAPSPSERTGAA